MKTNDTKGSNFERIVQCFKAYIVNYSYRNKKQLKIDFCFKVQYKNLINEV